MATSTPDLENHPSELSEFLHAATNFGTCEQTLLTFLGQTAKSGSLSPLFTRPKDKKRTF